MKNNYEEDLQAFALKYGVTRIKIETPNFDRDYRRGEDGSLLLKTEKAVIKALGKTTKVLIGDDHPHKTYEEAEAFARSYWSEYFKSRRQRRTDAERAGEARRQKRYRERQRDATITIKRQQ